MVQFSPWFKFDILLFWGMVVKCIITVFKQREKNIKPRTTFTLSLKVIKTSYLTMLPTDRDNDNDDNDYDKVFLSR